MKPLPLHRRLRRRRGDHRLGVHHEGELARFAVLQQVGVFRRLFAREPRLVADLDAAQPLHPHIAFPARHDEPQRIAVLRPQHLAVHAIGDQAIVERLGERDRARHRRGVGALRQDPFGVRLEAGLVEQQLQRHAGVFDAMHHAVGVLAAIELRAAPLHAAIGRAFQEMDAVDAREALHVVKREDQRLVDQAMHHQPVVGRIDLGDAGMMPLEAQPVRRDDAVERMQRREADGGFRRRGQPRHGAADDVLLVFRRQAVGAHADAVAERLAPVRHVGRQVLRIVGPRGAGSDNAGRSREKAAARTAVSCRGRPFYIRLGAGYFYAAIGRNANNFFSGDVTFHHFPDRRAFGPLVDAGPAGDGVIRPARSACPILRWVMLGDALADRLRRRSR